MENGTTLLFREEQSPSTGTPVWFIGLGTFPCLIFPIPIALMAFGIAYVLLERNVEGIFCFVGGLVLFLTGITASKAGWELWNENLIVEVHLSGVTIQCNVKRSDTLSIPYSEIVGCAYGELPLGYVNGATTGVQGRAYSINSGDGVWIKLKDGEQIFISSMRPLELMDAIDKIKVK